SKLYVSSYLDPFLSGTADKVRDLAFLEQFAQLDDIEIFGHIKHWRGSEDKVLALLCQGLVDRRLLKISLQQDPFDPSSVDKLLKSLAEELDISEEEAGYFVFTDSTSNSAYDLEGTSINIYFGDGQIKDIAEASDQLNISVLSGPVVKYYLCSPKSLQ
ncbi:MAG: phosphohydrolase, partial [Bacteroidetes bacterium]|nr:phosphohydrolase [Bacteroidota bacterium]